MKCMLYKSDGTAIDVTEITGNWSIQGAKKECSRTLDIPFLRPKIDAYLPSIPVELGDTIELFELDEKTGKKIDVYKGVVWERDLEDNSIEVPTVCYDKAIYLNKSDPKEQVYKDKKASEVTKSILSELGLEAGDIADGEKDTYNGRGMKAYDLIMHAYTKANKKNKKKYMLIAKGDKIHVFESGKKHPIVLEELTEAVPGKLLKTSFKESLDDLVNEVEVIEDKKEDKKEKKEQDKKSQEKYGLVQKIIRGEDADINGTLNKAKRDLTIECVADWDMITGMSMQIKSTVIEGDFYIVSDKHEFKDGIHTATLELSTEFEMDEREEGKTEEEKTEEKKTEEGEIKLDGVASGNVSKMLALGKTKLGNKYVWGAAGPNTFDCSGFVSWCAIQAGLMPPGSRITSGNMSSKYVHKVSWNDLRPGDILHFRGNPGHVAFYAGNGKTLECAGGNRRGSVKSLPLRGKGIYKNVYRFNKAG